MSRFNRVLLLILVLSCLALPFNSFMENETLTQEELTDLLYEMSLEDEGEFTVLPEDYQEPITGLEGTYHLLLMGVDTDGQGITGRSDTMVLAILNTRQNSVKLISFMRDLYVKIPGRGHNRLNAAYVYGGPELLVKTITQEFQVRVDGFLAVDFGLMAKLIDAIGGIQVTVSEQEFESLNAILSYYNKLHEVPENKGLLLTFGDVLLTGHQAMSYARIRKMDSDFERVKRQQNTLKAIFHQIMTLSGERMGELITQFAGEVKTDVSLMDAFELVALVYRLDDIRFDSLTIPIKGGYKNVMKNKAAFLVPNLKRNIKAITEFLVSETLPDTSP